MSFLSRLSKTDLASDDELSIITSDGVLDTNSSVARKKLKHNLEVLMQRAKDNGEIDKFMIIRDDNFFPRDWEWRVSSKDTCLERVSLNLSSELKKAYALEQAGIASSFNGINIPLPQGKVNEMVLGLDKNIGLINFPVRFRSTKHFTINTPLEVTGDYNAVSVNRNFTIIDNIDSFLSSGYGYSVSYHDAYLDVSHEGLSISEGATILIEKSRYEEMIKDNNMRNLLSQRKVVVYTGDEYLAIDMVLSELGVLPSRVGLGYATYDDEIKDILEESIKSLAFDNGLLYDQSHGGELKPGGGHFSSYFDDMNNDYKVYMEKFVQFLKSRFPKAANLISVSSINDCTGSKMIIDAVGTRALMEAINEYNILIQEETNQRFTEYMNDRETISTEVSDFFKLAIRSIDMYYKDGNYPLENRKDIEEAICHFMQDSTVREQLVSGRRVLELLEPQNTLNQKIEVSDGYGKSK